MRFLTRKTSISISKNECKQNYKRDATYTYTYMRNKNASIRQVVYEQARQSHSDRDQQARNASASSTKHRHSRDQSVVHGTISVHYSLGGNNFHNPDPVVPHIHVFHGILF
jgi:hypothetical protein